MNSQHSRSRSDLMILLLLPAPVTGILLILVAFYAIASNEGISLGKGDADQVNAVVEPTRTLSPNAASIATIAAAPVRQYTPPDVTSGGASEIAMALGYDEATVSRGQTNFLAICTACHGVDAHGISGLGKTLIGSEFVNTQTDEDLLNFVITGRPIWDPLNTTGVEMPPRGGNPGLTDEDIHSIIAYIRVLNGEAPVQPVAAAGEATSPGTDTNSTEFVAPDAGAVLDQAGIEVAEADSSTARDGAALFNTLCSTEGNVPGGVTVCDFIGDSLSLMEPQTLFDTLINGMSAFDRNNTTGVNILPRLGYPPLTDAEIVNLVSYVAESEGVEFAADSITLTEAPPASPSEGFVVPDVSALLASLGVVLPEPEPRPERDGETVYADVCGIRYGESVIPEHPDFCDYIKDNVGSMDQQELVDLLVNGSPLWKNDAGINILPRVAYPSLTDSEIQNLIDYIAANE